MQARSLTLPGSAILGFSAPIAALMALNFFMADVRDGLGPYLAAFLQQHGWRPGDTGMILTLGGLVGMVATIPAGALVDATRKKRALMVVASLLISGSCLALLWGTNPIVVIGTQVAIPLAGAVIGPAIAGITLGIVGSKGYAKQLGRNQAANHSGNVAGASAGGIASWASGLAGVLGVQVLMTVGAIIAALAIDPKSIDHAKARASAEGDGKPASFLSLLKIRPLLFFALTLACFHLGNAAMLPLVGLRLGQTGSGAAAGMWISAAVIIAQLVMIPTALLAARVADRQGYRLVVLTALLVLPTRGLLAAILPPQWGILPVQMLDGVGAGLLGVATPGLAAQIMAGTGRYNAGLGAIMTMQGVGASLSPTLGGWVAQKLSFATAFGVLGAIAAVAIPIFLFSAVPSRPEAENDG